MNSQLIKDEIVDIVRAEQIEKIESSQDFVKVNLNCYALGASAIVKLDNLATRAKTGCVITIQSVQNPKLQIYF